MVGFLSDCKNISVFSLYGNRENFSAQTTGLLFRNNHKMPRKKMKTATFSKRMWNILYILSTHSGIARGFLRSNCRRACRRSVPLLFMAVRISDGSRFPTVLPALVPSGRSPCRNTFQRMYPDPNYRSPARLPGGSDRTLYAAGDYGVSSTPDQFNIGIHGIRAFGL